MSDEGSLDAVEQLIPLAESAGLSLMHMALAFVVAHPALTLRDHRPAHHGAT